jgi:hypothetical protein
MSDEMILFLVNAAIAALQRHPHGAAILATLLALGAFVSAANGLIPSTWRVKPYVGFVARWVDRLAATTSPDAHGTLKMPGTASKPIETATPVAVERVDGESAR